MVRREQVLVGDGVLLSALRRGGEPDAPPFLLVHGLASNARMWDGVGERMTDRGHPSVAVDQRGHGMSPSNGGGFDFATLAGDLATVAASSFDAPVVAVGQSWGGNVVLEMAVRYPEVVAGLALVDGGFLTLGEAFPEWSDAAAQLAPPELEGMLKTDLENHMRARLDGWPETGIQGQLNNFEVRSDGTIRPHLSRRDHMAILRELWEHRPDDRAARVKCPTLVISVDAQPDKRRRVERFVRRLERGRVVWVDGHHDVHAQQPDLVAGLLAELVEELS